MIINIGQRTDIPAFYSNSFINRIKEAFVYVRNPFYLGLVTTFLLDPKIIDVIEFCTKNPHPMLCHLEELKKYKQFWYVTITAFGKELEPNVPSVDKVIDDFKILSDKLGKNSVALRYTPIIVNEKYLVERHIRAFEYIFSHLEGYTDLCPLRRYRLKDIVNVFCRMTSKAIIPVFVYANIVMPMETKRRFLKIIRNMMISLLF